MNLLMTRIHYVGAFGHIGDDALHNQFQAKQFANGLQRLGLVH